MICASALSFVDALRQHQLLEPGRLSQLSAAALPTADPRVLARDLLQRGWLTHFQINQLLRGRGQELVLGPYLLLDRLGEGAMGEVYKARQRKLGHVVALKVLRKDRFANRDVVRRFRREIRTAAQLNHPNIVRAVDADQVGNALVFAMEFVDGVDLARLVRQSGPLPVPQACDFIRQAACGLAHAHERGLVHRDIKPGNLMLTHQAQGAPSKRLIKILDLGLARLHPAAGCSDSTSGMTQEGMVVGTLDYIAPEQALDSRGVDIRADLYGLGCTFYFLLSGDVPFPGGAPLEKLLRHRTAQAAPIEQVRPEVPAEVAAIVRKLMAKDPADRYQTPAELATALAGHSRSTAVVLPPRPVREATVAEGSPHDSTRTFLPSQASPRALARRFLVVAGCIVVLGLALLSVLLARPGIFAAQASSAGETALPDAANGAAGAAVELFDGVDLAGWRRARSADGKSKWTVGYASLHKKDPTRLSVSQRGEGGPPQLCAHQVRQDVYTEQKFGDGKLDLQFLLPRGSVSGVFVLGEYGVRLADTAPVKEPIGPESVSVSVSPRVSTGKRAGEWQRLVIDYQAARFADGQKTANARFLKIILNDQVIHENVELPGPTREGLTGKEAPTGPVLLQGTHGSVAFRSLRFTPRR